jgi:hypothetical protein
LPLTLPFPFDAQLLRIVKVAFEEEADVIQTIYVSIISAIPQYEPHVGTFKLVIIIQCSPSKCGTNLYINPN